MNSNRNESVELDFKEILMVLQRRIVAIVATTMIIAVLTGIVSIYFITPMYTAVSKIYILTADSMVNLGDLQLGSSLATDYQEVIKTRPVLEEVIENLKLDITYEELLECISLTNPSETRIIQIQVTYEDPVIAKEIAEQVSLVSRTKIAEIMKVAEPTVLEEAIVPAKQSSPNNLKNIMLGAVLGFVISATIFVLQHVLDDTLKTADDVEKYLGLNMLAAIPAEGGTDNSEKRNTKRWKGIGKKKS